MTLQDLGYSESDSYEGSIEVTESTGVAGPLVNFIGAVVSIGLIGGIGVWGYQLLVRDVTGVPVVRALEGDMRTTPDTHGGSEADYQGLAVNAVAAENSDSGPVERVILAPQPIELAEEDRSIPDLAAVLATQAPAPRPVPQEPVLLTGQPAPAPAAEQEAEPEVLAAAAIDDAVADALVSLTAHVEDAPEAEITAGLDLRDLISAGIGQGNAEAFVQPASFTAPALVKPDFAVPEAAFNSRSPVPRARPGEREVVEVAYVAPAVVKQPVELAAESVASGSRLVQLGAYASPEVARSEWDRISGNFTELFTNHQRVVQKAQTRGKTFYRLRVSGFDDLADARRFCAVLTSKQADCIPVSAK